MIVKGPKGSLSRVVNAHIKTVFKDGQIEVQRKSEAKLYRSMHGLYRTLIANMVEGVSKGFEKKLEIRGVGYRAEMNGNRLTIHIGYSHPIVFVPPEGIDIKCESPT
ncbi:MAG: 50S ribosomal protein L6, partial [Calditrichaeota bacterium]